MTNYVLYDYLQVSGGAERLSLELAAGLPDTSLVVSRVYPAAASLRPFDILGGERFKCVGQLTSLPSFRLLDAIAGFVWNTRFLASAESVIYSGIYAPFAVANQKRGKRCYYCHTPPRYMYDWRSRYMAQTPAFARPALSITIDLLRKRYESSLRQMDVILANSESVRRRLNKYLGMDAVVIYPPIDSAKFRWVECGNYFISLARLQPQKRVDRIIEAFLHLPDQKLIIASGGSDEARLKRFVGNAPNIVFVGWQSDEQLCRLIGGARAALYLAEDEDFGMSPVEAMAAGKPVIGVREGGLVETIIDGETGVLLSPDFSRQSLIDAIVAMSKKSVLAMRQPCEQRALSFSKEKFLKQIKEVAFT